jgi:cysteinyl-tRNA synthetase
MRLLILSTHYRAPVSFTEETVQSTVNELAKVQKAYNQLAVAIQLANGDLNSKDIKVDDFIAAMADDLNTSNAIAAMFEKVKQANVELRKRPLNMQEIEGIFASLNAMLNVFGIKFEMPILTAELRKTYEEYLALKAEKRFEESDKLRAVLMKNNII